MSNKLGFAGKYKIVIHKGNENEPTRVVDWFDNVITNIGLDRLGLSGGFSNTQYCLLGTGSTAPSPTDVGLVSKSTAAKGVSAVTSGTATTAPYFSWRRTSYVFNPGEATGNISEMSVGWSTDNVSAFSRCLITENGNPITVTVLPTDFVTVYYELRLYPNMNILEGTIALAGVDYDYKSMPFGVTTGKWNGNLIGYSEFGTIQSYNARDGGVGTPLVDETFTQEDTIWYTSTLSPYVQGSYERNFSFTIPVNRCNFTNFLKSLYLIFYGYAFKYGFTPAIPKDNTKTLTLNFRISWGRYTA